MNGLFDPLVWAIALGALSTTGLVLVGVGAVPRTVRLHDALTQLAGPSRPSDPVLEVSIGDGWDARLGRWAYSRLHLRVSDGTRRRLELRGRPVSDFLAEKIILMLAGAAIPQLFSSVLWLMGIPMSPLPLVVSLALAAAGYFWPDFTLRQGKSHSREDARQALLTYFDLVTLERLANQSAIASLHVAAELSDAVLFVRLRDTLARARLEQRPPWTDLEHLAVELDLPEIRDLSDVLRLDEQGAALADALRARVQELRDAQLSRERIAAQKTSESMSVWMVIPTLVMALVLLSAPLLKLVGA